ncbi:regulatory protein, luxR family [Malonomonas rubra DSM 5091]|uniref:Regulatory protein, luxR family n=1 Tax=Malonomonas rubra DSM 5091 TaxID=1122189 RepID=A0A1M6FNU2_MALRU|nr:helix-turn-helix transcriptional regulator [Malonomonas rubra]SHI99323.1 regulatory protein, luxR family [Malonomonas rubra DSM 5091]
MTRKKTPAAQQQAAKNTSSSKLETQLRERVKELNCLYKLAELIEKNEDSVDAIMQGAVALLPISWQYPEITCAKIRYRDQIFQSRNFRPSQWRQKSPIIISGYEEGRVEVHYLKKKPQLDEGPFLKEERQLIDAVSDRLAKAVEKIHTKRQLQVERQALQDANAALHDSLVLSQKEKKKLGSSIQAKIDKIITPILYALQAEMNPGQQEYLELLKKNLADIVTPFVESSPKVLSILSPVEVQICNMIKNGLSSKEIARIRGISPATVNRHRESIRRKLGLTNQKENLTTYLSKVLAE